MCELHKNNGVSTAIHTLLSTYSDASVVGEVNVESSSSMPLVSELPEVNMEVGGGGKSSKSLFKPPPTPKSLLKVTVFRFVDGGTGASRQHDELLALPVPESVNDGKPDAVVRKFPQFRGKVCMKVPLDVTTPPGAFEVAKFCC